MLERKGKKTLLLLNCCHLLQNIMVNNKPSLDKHKMNPFHVCLVPNRREWYCELAGGRGRGEGKGKE